MAIQKDFVIRQGLQVATNVVVGTYTLNVANPPLNGLIVSGSVGIGTSNPTAALQVVGNINLTNTATTISGIKFADGTYQNTSAANYHSLPGGGSGSIQFNSGGCPTNFCGTSLFVYKCGSVGIGTSAPAYVLDVRSNTSMASFATTPNCGADYTVRVGPANGCATILGWNNTHDYAWLSTCCLAPYPSLMVTTCGHVGINVNGICGTLPQAALGVNGNATIGYSGSAAAPVNGLLVQGRVAINSCSPHCNQLYVNLGSNPGLAINRSCANSNSMLTLIADCTALFNITSVGNVNTGGWNGQTVNANYGGTGQSTYALGDLLYANGSGSIAGLSRLPLGAGGQALLVDGCTSLPVWGCICAASHIAGVLPITHGGTNTASFGCNAIIVNKPCGTALTSLITGDCRPAAVVFSGSGVPTVAVPSGTGQYLSYNNPSGQPAMPFTKNWPVDGSLVGTTDSFYTANPYDYRYGDIIDMFDQTPGSTFYYQGRIVNILFAGGFGYEVTAEIIAADGTPNGTPNQSWSAQLAFGGDLVFSSVCLVNGVTNTLPAFNGGTGYSEIGQYQLLVGGTGNTWNLLSSTVTSALVTSMTGSPQWVSGTTGNTVLRSNGTTVSFDKVRLTSDVSGVLPYGSGGTNASVCFTQGSIIYAGADAFRQCNNNLFYCSCSVLLGIGTNTPTTTLDVAGAATLRCGANVVAGGLYVQSGAGTFACGISTRNLTSNNWVNAGSIYSNTSITASGQLQSNTAVFNTSVTICGVCTSYGYTSGALVVAGGVGIGGNLNVAGYGCFSRDVNVVGNITVGGNIISVNTSSLNLTNPTIGLGSGCNGNALVSNDGRDRGVLMNYWCTSVGQNDYAFMGRRSATGDFIYITNVQPCARNIANVANPFIPNSPGYQWGTAYFGNIHLVSNAVSISTSTGAVIIPCQGGIGVGGNVNIGQQVAVAESATVGGTTSLGTNCCRYLELFGSACGYPVIRSAGACSVGLIISSGGTGCITFNSGTSASTGTSTGLVVKCSSNSVGATNYLTVQGTASGAYAVFGSAGVDTNVSISIAPKGTGNVLIDSGVAAVSTTTGALIVPGGVGVGGNLVTNGLRVNSANLALGTCAGVDQSSGAVALGNGAGRASQHICAVAIGTAAGQLCQDIQSIAVGAYAGTQCQHTHAVAMGSYAGAYFQNQQAVAIGQDAGNAYQGTAAVALGSYAGTTRQGCAAVSIGAYAGSGTPPVVSYVDSVCGTVLTLCGSCCIIAGMRVSGAAVPGNTYVVAVLGCCRVQVSQTCVPPSSTLTFAASQSCAAVAIGCNSGRYGQSCGAVAVGVQAGHVAQGSCAVALGPNAGAHFQSYCAVAIGSDAGSSCQGQHAVAIGGCAALLNQGMFAVAIGNNAGRTNQGQYGIGLGMCAGACSQGICAVAIGQYAGSRTQGNSAVAIGLYAGNCNQGIMSIAIGCRAGSSHQGDYAIAIGTGAGNYFQAGNSIVLNANASPLNGSCSGLYINPIRHDCTNLSQAVFYNTGTKELTFAAISSASSNYGNANVASYLSGPVVIGNLHVTNATASTCTSTGAVTVVGGVGIGGSLNVGCVSNFLCNVYIGSLPGPSCCAYMPSPLVLNNSGSGIHTQIDLINTHGGSGTGSGIDFYTYLDVGNGQPGARFAAIDNGNFSACFEWYAKENGSGGNGCLIQTMSLTGQGTLQIYGTGQTTNSCTGALIVCGGIVTNNNLWVGGSSWISNLSVTGNISSTSYNSGTVVVIGGVGINGNLNVRGNIVGSDVTVISGNSGAFYGNGYGYDALYAGIPVGYVYQPNTITQFSANANDYAQINLQNINSGPAASGCFVITADNGNADKNFIVMGMNSSTYCQSGQGLQQANDGYLFVNGCACQGFGGNLNIATTAGRDIVFSTNGIDTANEIVRFKNAQGVIVYACTPSMCYQTGALVVCGGAGFGGSVNSNQAIAATTTIAANSFVMGGNIASISTTGTVTVDSWGAETYRTVHYLAQVTCNTNPGVYHSEQLFILQDGATSYQTDFNLVFTCAPLGAFSSSITGSVFSLYFTPYLPTNKSIRVVRTGVDA